MNLARWRAPAIAGHPPPAMCAHVEGGHQLHAAVSHVRVISEHILETTQGGSGMACLSRKCMPSTLPTSELTNRRRPARRKRLEAPEGRRLPRPSRYYGGAVRRIQPDERDRVASIRS
jgi:hypothetical protein